MGTSSSKSKGKGSSSGGSSGANKGKYVFGAITDKYHTLEQVQEGMRKAGLESSNLILGVDFTKSNEWTGKNSYAGKCLHYQPTDGTMNPYQQVISIVARTLEAFDDDKLIPAYGFGDVTTSDKSVFPFFPEERPCNGVTEVLQRYTEIVPHVQLSGPTSFEPLINKAIEIVTKTKQYHILVIIADGQVSNEAATRDAIVRASAYPISIVTIGVGDGPWEVMHEFDDGLPTRKFDNFQFVSFNEVMSRKNVENYEVEFATAALMEIPEQYQAIKALHLL